MPRVSSEGVVVETLGVLIKFRMSREVAGKVKRRFAELIRDGAGVSYLDCVLFDSALSELGEEQSYYGIDDDEFAEVMKKRAMAEASHEAVRIIDVTDAWSIVE